jgi:hypothetical protein
MPPNSNISTSFLTEAVFDYIRNPASVVLDDVAAGVCANIILHAM